MMLWLSRPLEGSEIKTYMKRIFDMKRILSLGFIAVILAITAFAPRESTAHAAALTVTSQCSSSLGTLIETDPIKAGSTTLGYLNVYYNGSNGYNCAETTSATATYGTSKYMQAALITCTQTSPSSTCTPRSENNGPYYASDEGSYSYYAGPVGVNGSGHCIMAFGEIDWKGGDYTINTHGGGASHCA
jgi:hypothetical protein